VTDFAKLVVLFGMHSDATSQLSFGSCPPYRPFPSPRYSGERGIRVMPSAIRHSNSAVAFLLNASMRSSSSSVDDCITHHWGNLREDSKGHLIFLGVSCEQDWEFLLRGR